MIKNITILFLCLFNMAYDGELELHHPKKDKRLSKTKIESIHFDDDHIIIKAKSKKECLIPQMTLKKIVTFSIILTKIKNI